MKRDDRTEECDPSTLSRSVQGIADDGRRGKLAHRKKQH